MASLGWFEEFTVNDDARESSSSTTTASADSNKPAAAEEIPFESDIRYRVVHFPRRQLLHAEGCGLLVAWCLVASFYVL